MAPIKGETPEMKCDRYAQMQQKLHNKILHTEISNVMKDHPSCLPQIHRYLVSLGLVNGNNSRVVKTSPADPKPEYDENSKAHAPVQAEAKPDADDAVVKKLGSGDLSAAAWDKNVTVYSRVQPPLWRKALGRAVPHIFGGDRLRVAQRRGQREVTVSRLQEFAEFVGGINKSDPIDIKYRTEEAFCKHFQELHESRGCPADRLVVCADETEQWLRSGAFVVEKRGAASLTVTSPILGCKKVVKVENAEASFFIENAFSLSNATLRCRDFKYERSMASLFGAEIDKFNKKCAEESLKRAKKEAKAELAQSSGDDAQGAGKRSKGGNAASSLLAAPVEPLAHGEELGAPEEGPPTKKRLLVKQEQVEPALASQTARASAITVQKRKPPPPRSLEQ